LDSNQEQVKEFFNSHSKDYRKKYHQKDIFYEYFFYERLDEATNELDFTDKSILDVGAGTGPLYDYLLEKDLDLKNYRATDISDEMLGQSKIPKENYYIGDLLEMNFEESFDLVFMLGVTTYMDHETIEKSFSKIATVLKPNGKLIVTFTNRKSIDIITRSFLKPIAKIFSGKNTILSQGFSTWYYTTGEINKMVDASLKIQKIKGLNHTFFPFSRLLPKFSVYLGKRLHGTKNMYLSSDLLYFIQKRS